MGCRSAICLVIDRLPAHLLGAYGNTWIHTSAFDSLAAEALLCEFAMIDSPRLEAFYRVCAHGLHAACPADAAAGGSSGLASLLRGAGVQATLVTDEPQVATHPFAEQCQELVALSAGDEAEPAGSVESTGLGRFFADAAEAIGSLQSSTLLWLHSRGLSGPWDAPYALRSRYAAEDDPPPPTAADVPNLLLRVDHDPDQRLGIVQSAAAQVTAADVCLGALLDALDESPRREDTLLIVVGARGFPLGEHLRVGTCDEALYGELVHVPLLVRLPRGQAAPLRTTALVQPADLFHTLLDWWGVAAPQPAATPPLSGRSLLALTRAEPAAPRDRAVAVGPGQQWAIRTPSWVLRRSIAPSGGRQSPETAEHDSAEHESRERRELFAKPDDRFEVNDVARRCDDVVEQLAAAAAEYLQTAAAGRGGPPALGPLSDVLLHGLA